MSIVEFDTLRGVAGFGIDAPKELKQRIWSETIAEALLDRFDEFVKIKRCDKKEDVGGNEAWSFEIKIAKKKSTKEVK